MAKKFAVIGLGYFGERIALELTERGAEVLVIDNTMSKIEEIKDKVAYAVRMDSTDDKALQRLDLQHMDAVIVAIGENFESALLTCVQLLQYGCLRVIVKSTSPLHTSVLTKVGVHSIVSPEDFMAERLATTLTTENILDSIPLTEEYSITQVQAPEHMVGYTLQEIGMRRKYDVNLITIKRIRSFVNSEGEQQTEEHVIGVPQPDTRIAPQDILVLLGKQRDIEKLNE